MTGTGGRARPRIAGRACEGPDMKLASLARPTAACGYGGPPRHDPRNGRIEDTAFGSRILAVVLIFGLHKVAIPRGGHDSRD